MTIEDRNLAAGTKLWANYKKTRYICTVEEGDEGKLRFRVEGIDTAFASPSSAGMAVMDGKAVNGWRFWSLEGTEPAATETSKESKPAKPRGGKAYKTLYRIPNGKIAEGKSRWFCVSCMKSFLVDGDTVPTACPGRPCHGRPPRGGDS